MEKKQAGGSSHSGETGGANQLVCDAGGANQLVCDAGGANIDSSETSCTGKGGETCATVPGEAEMSEVNNLEGKEAAKSDTSLGDNEGEPMNQQKNEDSIKWTNVPAVNDLQEKKAAKSDPSFEDNDDKQLNQQKDTLSQQNDGKTASNMAEADTASPTTSDQDVSPKSGSRRVHSTTPGCSNCSTILAKLNQEEERCTILRDNIHKVSANWFQRKTQLSESENEGDVSPVPLLSATKKMAEDEIEEDGMTCCGGVSEKAINRSKDMTKLVSIISQKSAQLDLSDSQCRDLKKRMREYEKIIDDKEDIIHGLKEQLETYLTDNQNMSVQLNNLASLFQQLEKVDKETVSVPQATEAEVEASATVPLPTQGEFQEMASSVSRTYIKLKDLIYEKKALVTEIERLNTLNVELQRRVVQQETRLLSVSDALHQTWLVVSDLKDQHAKLHDDELIMKYELKEKREILTKLRRELESARAQWQVIRQKNFESELEYTSIREMLQERRKASQDEQILNEEKKEREEEEPDEAVCLHPDDTKSFDPPVDLLLEMGLEYGIIGEDAEMTQTVLDVIRGEDVRNNRLEQLEEHCSLLYQKLLSSTSRSLSLASRLSRLHTQFSSSDDELEGEFMIVGDEGDEEEGEEGDLEGEEGEGHMEDTDQEVEDEEEAQYYSDAIHTAVMESVLSSPDSEEYDTAYVSETEGQDVLMATHITVDNIQELSEPETQPGPSEAQSILDGDLGGDSEEVSLSAELEENCDHLSRRLINFLPRKIEFLKVENKKLELSVSGFKEERERMEHAALRLEKDKEKLEEELKALTKDMTVEKLQRIQLEQQLKHLGKCVDELKLKHQAEKKAQTTSSSSKQQQSKGEEQREEEQGGGEGEEGEERRGGEGEERRGGEGEERRGGEGEERRGGGEGEEERSREDEQMRREVELVKKAMELKKKEKELRRKEEEMVKREKEIEERVRDSSSAMRRGEEEAQRGEVVHLPPPITAPPSGGTPSTPLPCHIAAEGNNNNSNSNNNITRVGELVMLLLQRVTAENPPTKENGLSGFKENCSSGKTTVTNISLSIPNTSSDITQDEGAKPSPKCSRFSTECSANTECSTSSTECSASSTESTISNTGCPAATLDSSKSNAESSSSTTESPMSTTVHLTSTTESSVPTTKSSASTTEYSTPTTKCSASITEYSASSTECSTSSTEHPTSTTGNSTPTTKILRPVSQTNTQQILSSDSLLPRITLEPQITYQLLESQGPLVAETTVTDDDFLVIPLQLTVPGQEIILRIHATQDASLVVLQSYEDSTAATTTTVRSASALSLSPPRLLVPPLPLPSCGSCLRLTTRRHTITCLAVITTTAAGSASARVTYSAELGKHHEQA